MASTTVEITIGYLTIALYPWQLCIYNSRNYYRLLNLLILMLYCFISTTVEITIGYLTSRKRSMQSSSTTVEITIGYLTCNTKQ